MNSFPLIFYWKGSSMYPYELRETSTTKRTQRRTRKKPDKYFENSPPPSSAWLKIARFLLRMIRERAECRF